MSLINHSTFPVFDGSQPFECWKSPAAMRRSGPRPQRWPRTRRQGPWRGSQAPRMPPLCTQGHRRSVFPRARREALRRALAPLCSETSRGNARIPQAGPPSQNQHELAWGEQAEASTHTAGTEAQEDPRTWGVRWAAARPAPSVSHLHPVACRRCQRRARDRPRQAVADYQITEAARQAIRQPAAGGTAA